MTLSPGEITDFSLQLLQIFQKFFTLTIVLKLIVIRPVVRLCYLKKHIYYVTFKKYFDY